MKPAKKPEPIRQQSVMVMLDNSSSSINQDFYPNRWQTQLDYIEQLMKIHLEQKTSSFGIGTLAGTPKILCKPTVDQSELQSYMWDIPLQGEVKFYQALNMAALALKNRSSLRQKPRILVFLTSKITDPEDKILQMALKFKKINIAITIIAFGNFEATSLAEIKQFIGLVNFSDNSMLVHVEPSQSKSLTNLLEEMHRKTQTNSIRIESETHSVQIQEPPQQSSTPSLNSIEIPIQQHSTPIVEEQQQQIIQQKPQKTFKRDKNVNVKQQIEDPPQFKFGGQFDIEQEKQKKKNKQDVLTDYSQNVHEEAFDFPKNKKKQQRNKQISQLFKTRKAQEFIKDFQQLNIEQSQNQSKSSSNKSYKKLQNTYTQKRK